MGNILERLIKALAYVAAAVVILLAVAVGLFRLLLPRLPEYQEEIKGWANAAIGMTVEFADMNARWRLSGPELTFQGAELTAYGAKTSLLTAGEVSVGVSLMRLLAEGELVVDRIQIRDTRLTLQLNETDGWLVQGLPAADILGSWKPSGQRQGNVVVVAEGIAIDYLPPDSSEVLSFSLDRLEVASDETQVVINASLGLPDSIGERLTFSASQRSEEVQQGRWQFFLEGKGLLLPGWSALDTQRIPAFRSGILSLNASFQITDLGIDRATADLVLIDVAGAGDSARAPIDVQGRFEYSRDAGGWLVAASNTVINTVDGTWPRASFSIAAGASLDNEIRDLSASASYLNLGDWQYFSGWLPEKIASTLNEYDPSGELLDLQLSLDNLQSEDPGFAVATELVDAGIAATESLPGFRLLSGLVRTDNFGGRLEIDSAGLIVDLASQLAEPISFDDAIGTIIWRRNARGTTVLSDNILIRNADFDSRSSLQISIPSGEDSPIVDFQSNWSVNDLSAVGRYLPAKLIKPGLYRWLSAALVDGNAPRGSTQLSGPMDKFPFDNGEGIFRIEGRLENTTLRYSDKWPDAKNMTLDVVVDGMKLYSHRNSTSNAGNRVENARIEIADLRQPVLEIEAFATGSLESIREFSQNSPIATVFGGHLAKVSVQGDASFNLQFTFPILDRDNYTFSTSIQTSDGTLSFDGFQPELTELNGIVSVTRDGVSSESLFGRFLGEQVNIDLKPAGDDLPSYTVVAEASGRLSGVGLVAELAPPLENLIDGSTSFEASIRFPKSGLEQPVPLQIVVDTGLEGMAIDLPVPLKKAPESAEPLSLIIEFPEEGRISATGSLAEKLQWVLSFVHSEQAGWDFDRGTLAVGGYKPEQPDIRGLHIVGETDSVSLDDWLALARGDRGNAGSDRLGVADRIRTVNLAIGNLHVLGQDLKNHRVEVQRSARDWLVTLSGEQVTGSVSVPYDFASGRPLIFDMETLILPGADKSRSVALAPPSQTDPRRIPPLSIKARNFALGARFFGELNAEFASTRRGIESTAISMRDDSFSLDGMAGWIVDTADDTSQHTYLIGKLVSTDIEATMSRLDYEPGISGENMQIDLDLNWPGSPGEDFLDKLNGTVALDVGSGMLQDVDPGAGRVFGLMSVVALPRRLSLDFHDVFDKGFGFDVIKGTFNIENGQAYTCDLSLEGPAADVGIVGRAGLATRDYDQTAIVSANFGNTLPILGAVVAGPQVAAALLIFSQIFKKPLQEAGQVYYGIDGSWDSPDISTAKVERFAMNSSAAGCLQETQSE